jgi:hypothetical protein
MTKLVLDTVNSGINISTINENFQKIEDEFQNKILYRDNPIGEPNALVTDIDTNGKRIYNLPVPLLSSEAARLQDVQNAISNSSANLISNVPAGNISATNVQTAINELDTEKVSLVQLAASNGTTLIGGTWFGSVIATVSQLASSIGSSLIGWIQSGTGAVIKSIQSKLRESISVKDFGAVGDGVTDDTLAIQAAINAASIGRRILFPSGTYKISTTITFSAICQTLEGEANGGLYGVPKLLWSGPLGGIMVKAGNGKHYPTIRNMLFDANRLANTCVFIEALAGSQTNNPTLEHLTFLGYVTKGVILGVDDDTANSNGQMSNVSTTNLQWRGGGVANTIGFFMNAQNVEHCVGTAWYFDPWPDAGYFNHLNHVRIRAGGMSLLGLLTTRADSFAISTDDNIAVYDWRAEDRYLFTQSAIDNKAPSTLSNVVQRFNAGYSSGDYTLVLNGLVQPVVLTGATLQGSVLVGATSDRSFVGLGLSFPWGGSVVYAGTSNAAGMTQDLANGKLDLRGTNPGFKAQSRNGGIVAELGRRTQFGYLALPTGTTPDISGGTVFGTNNGGATTLTKLTNLQTGQLAVLIGNDGGLTTVASGTFIKLAGGVSFVIGTQDSITFIGGVSGEALELCRSNN